MAKKNKVSSAQTDTQVTDDELIEEVVLQPAVKTVSTEHVGDFLLKYRNFLAGVVVAVIAAVAGYFFYHEYLIDKNKEALDQMSGAVQFFEQDSIAKAIKGTSQYPGFESLVDDFGSTEAGNMCKYYLGICYLKQGKYAEGIEQLKSFSKGDNMMSAAAYAAIAYGHEELKEFDEAGDNFIKASEVKINDQTTPYYLMQAGRVYEYAEKNDEALRVYKRIKKEYPKSEEAANIDKLISKLEN